LGFGGRKRGSGIDILVITSVNHKGCPRLLVLRPLSGRGGKKSTRFVLGKMLYSFDEIERSVEETLSRPNSEGVPKTGRREGASTT